jgi:hypothetical protein
MKIKYTLTAFRSSHRWEEIKKPFFFDDHTFLISANVDTFLDSNSLDSHWKEWIGSMSYDELKRDCDTVLFSWGETASPEILDGENETLRSRSFELIRMLPMVTSHCFAHTNHIFSLTGQGTFNQDKYTIVDVRSVLTWPPFRRSFFFEPELNLECPFFSPNDFLSTWKKIAKLVNDKIFIRKNRQLLEGYRSIEEAFRTNQLEFKIPNLVRAIECLVDCRGADDFSEKVAWFNGPPAEESVFKLAERYSEDLRLLYQLRNDCSHGKEFGWSLKKQLPGQFGEKLVARYEALAEWAARAAFFRAITDESLEGIFLNRDSLIEGWQNIKTSSLSKE